MERHLDAELGNLRSTLTNMAAQVEMAIERSIRSLKERELQMAEEVITQDHAIDQLEIQVENQCFTILARQQPVAADLRFIMACIKINNDLERMGDQAVNIAQKARNLIQEPEIKPLIDIPYMAGIAMKMVKDSLDAFLEHDIQKARAVCESDDIVDGLERQIIRELTTYMIENPKTISRALDLIVVAKSLERIADLATNICEEVVFIVEAKTIKHHYSE